MGERLLSGPRAIVRDLVSKRLWPIAVLLVVALVAVPVLVAGSGSAPPAAPAAAQPAAQTAGGTPITVVEQPVLGRGRPGAVRDPFFDPPAPKTESTSSSSNSSTSTSTSTSKTPTSGDSTPAETTGGGTSPATSAPDPAPASPSSPSSPSSGASVFRARVRWGPDATADTRGISRLQPLGGTSNPALLYLGTTADHERAVFLLGPNALTDDEKLCADKSCRIIALKAGESVGIGVVGTDGAADRSYELGVTSIPEIAVADEAAARALRARVHADGREVLRAMIKDPRTAESIGQLTYDRSIGAVVAIDAP